MTKKPRVNELYGWGSYVQRALRRVLVRQALRVLQLATFFEFHLEQYIDILSNRYVDQEVLLTFNILS